MLQRTRLTRIAVVGVVAALMATAAACGGSEGGSGSGGGGDGDGTLKIGVALDLSGQAAFAGLQVREGMEFAAEQIEESGMLGDRSLELVFVDMETDKDRGSSRRSPR